MALTIGEVLQQFEEQAQSLNIEKSSIEILIEDFFGFNNVVELKLHRNDKADSLDVLNNNFKRLCNGEPVQYILHKAWFYSHQFYVDNRVLIPRMETEELIDRALKEKNIRVVYDICCGSGCLGITYKLNNPNCEVYMSDISPEALEVSHKNASLLEANINLICSDLFNNFNNIPKADLIMCNPPYISKNEEIEPLVWNNEPHLALVPPSGDGLEIYTRIFKEINDYLNLKGCAYFEIGCTQKDDLIKVLKDLLPSYSYEFYNDMMNKCRILKIVKESD